MPIVAVVAMRSGLLTFQRNKTASDAALTKAVNQSPMAMNASKTLAPSMVPIDAA
ncbi:MAG: hypothetical protein WBF03_10350 [Xanthobacteraceae bacterium]